MPNYAKEGRLFCDATIAAGNPDPLNGSRLRMPRLLQSNHAMAAAVVPVLLLILASCQSAEKVDPYRFLRQCSLAVDEYYAAWGGLPIESVTTSSGGGYGAESSTYLTMNRGGSAAKRITHYRSGMVEEYRGAVSPWDFARLCLLIERARFNKYRDEYIDARTDAAGLFVAVNYRDGTTKRVIGYSDLAPYDLWLIAKVSEGIALGIGEWGQVSTSDK